VFNLAEVTYYARMSYSDDGIGSWFPDVWAYGVEGDTMEEAIENAKYGLTVELDISDDCTNVFYPPSTPEELEAEALANPDEFSEFELRREWVPITITPRNDSYLRNLKPHKRIKST